MRRCFLAALTMLTAIPVPGYAATEGELERCRVFFPLVGLLAGAATFGWSRLWLWLFPGNTMLAAVGSVIFMAMISRGFHLDGLADTADGFLSSRPRERVLEIMHDSHIGTMGVLAIVAVLGMKTAALAALPSALLPWAAGLAALSGRCGIVWYIIGSRYALETGLGAVMFRRRQWWDGGTALLLWLVAGWLLFGFPGLRLVVLLWLFAPVWAFYTRIKIGGATGDTIGAAEELTEMLTPLLLLLLLHGADRF
ncbi:MAG: adenosylcobinamide-GDP ribazoletransferase [Victivallales bacterium]|nr:adenosylcobinamide-GDP ribazoletransferase [Victivallales bacterium]